MACNPRNPRPATIFNNAYQHINVYGDDVEVDYRGYEVSLHYFKTYILCLFITRRISGITSTLNCSPALFICAKKILRSISLLGCERKTQTDFEIVVLTPLLCNCIFFNSKVIRLSESKLLLEILHQVTEIIFLN